MAYQGLFSIRYLNLEPNFQIDTPLFSITNSTAVKEKYFKGDFFGIVGANAAQAFKKNTFAFAEFGKNGMTVLPARAKQIETFLLFLWFVKDNSISLAESYGLLTDTNEWSYYNSHLISSNSGGNFTDIEFSEIEIRTAVDLLLKYTAHFPPDTTNSEKQEELGSGYSKTVKANRVERAFAFVQTARATPHLPQKITHYMSILECLFSTDTSEAVQKVSERTAYYVGQDRSSRLSTFKDIKEAYSVRSKFVHGGDSSKDYNGMAIISNKVDQIIRTVLTKIIKNDHALFLSKASLIAFLTDMIF